MIEISLVNILATVINILVLFLLVQKFLVKPLSNVIQKREDMINSQFREAKIAETEANNLKAQYESDLKHAREESLSILDKAREDAKSEYNRILGEADVQAKEMMEKARRDMVQEREQALKEAKTEIGDLIALAVDKVAGTKTSAQTDKELIDQFLADAEKEEN